jgi:lipoprotein-releasing system permease protein
MIALALALAATVYPAWRAAKVNPAEALRYE